MRVTFILMCCLVFYASASTYSQNTRLTLNLQNATILELIQDIESQSKFIFLYQINDLNLNKKVNAEFKDAKIEEILDVALKGEGLTYEVFEKQILISKEERGVDPGVQPGPQPRKKELTGTVKDAKGLPLPGVTVMVKGTTNGTITDNDGNFTLSVPESAKTIVFSYIGMKSQEFLLSGKSTFNVVMEEENFGVDEIVIVGYGSQKKTNLTGSVTSLRTEDLTKRQVTQTSNILQGLASGITVQQQSGKPGGDGATVHIRGLSSIYGGQDPLVMVDGVVSSLDNLNPNSIETISILKDAASTSIYGARAANGVILIQTKRAKDKGLVVSYNTYMTKQVATSIPQRTSAIEHMELSNIAEQNRTGDPTSFLYSKSIIDKYKTTAPNNMDVIDTDWLGLVLSNNGILNSHNISLTSGGDKANIFASLSYVNQEGLIQNSSYDRYDLRINPDFKIRKNLTISGVINYNSNMTITPSTASPEFIIRQAIGLPAVGGGKYGPGMYGTAGQTNNRNPLALAEATGTSCFNISDLLTKALINYKPIEKVEIEAFWALEQWTPHGKTFTKNADIFIPNITTQSYDKVALYPGITSLEENYSTNRRTTYLAQATFTHNIKDHNFRILVGGQAEELKFEGISASRTDFINPNQPYLNLGGANFANSGTGYETALAGFFGRINYNYKEKYLLELNGRYDGSSRFSQSLNRQLGLFHSLSAGWVFSTESFFKGFKDFISFGKLRGSWGILGNQSLPSVYPFAVNFNTGMYANPNNGTFTYIDNVTNLGYQLTEAPNPYITWEKSRQADIGIDLKIKNKINITFDYYVRSLKDMLLRRPIPDYVGLNAPYINAGSMENKGWEFSVNYKIKFDNVGVDITGIVSDVKNKVSSISGLPYLDGGAVRTYEGEALWSYYGYKSLGYFKDKTDIQNSPVQFGIPWNDASDVGPKPGDIKYADISGPNGAPDGQIDANDRTIIGNSFPRYEYSLDINLSYKKFDLNLFGQGVGKRSNYLSGTGAVPFASGDFAASLLEIHKDFWTETNQDARFPRLLPSGSGGNNFVTSSHWIKSAAYFRIKNVYLAYNLPDKWFKSVGLSGVRIYISGQNLFTVTKAWRGFDPEIDNANAEFYPLMKSFTAGFNVNF